jgi:plastocyanin
MRAAFQGQGGHMTKLSWMLAVLVGAVSLAAVALAAPDYLIIQKDRAFSVRTLTIRAGDRVVFTNADSITHNVYSVTPGLEFDLRSQAPGQSDTVTFAKQGTLVVECAIHPKMKLQVVVTP